MDKNREKYIFTGKVTPETSSLSMNKKEIFKGHFNEKKFSLEFFIHTNQVSIYLEIEHGNVSPETLRNYIISFIQPYISLYGFVYSCHMEVEILQMIKLDRYSPYVFGTRIDCIKDIIENKNEFLQNNMHIIFRPNFGMIMRDIVSAFNDSRNLCFYCYRAIEAMRKDYYQERNDDERNQNWINFKKDFEIQENDLEFLKTLATPNRHGDFVPFSDEDSIRILGFTYKAVIKWIEKTKP